MSYLFRNPIGGHTPVCQKFIVAAIGIKKDRLISIAKIINAGEIPKEKRGGDRKLKKKRGNEKENKKIYKKI